MPAMTLDLDVGVPLYVCEWCDTETGAVLVTADGCDVCHGCAATLSTCDRCDARTETTVTTAEGSEVCETCASRMTVCDDCGLPAGDTTSTATCRTVCDGCAENYWGCEECGYLIDEGDYCESCDESRSDMPELINDYSYQPCPEFHGDGPLYLGMELEIDVTDMYECAESAQSHLGSLGYLKEDGSIDNGFEIVTHPMTHRYAMDHFPWRMLDDLRADGCSGYGNGLHVHVSRAAFDGPTHVHRWMKLFYRNQSDVTAVARRECDEWAAFTNDGRAHVKDYAKGARDADRYQAINVQNFATFELRIFASSLDRQEVQAALGLAAASVEYTRDLTVQDITRGAWDWDAFAEWVADQPEYAPLAREMERASCAY